MRTAVPDLLPMFRSEMQVELLGLLILQPERSWTIQDLSRTLKAPGSSVHRELRRAVSAGLVTEESARRPHRYRAASEGPAYAPLRDLLSLTVGVEDRLRRALSGVEGVLVASIHGSWAKGTVTPTSDIDLLVVTEGDRAAVLRAARSVGRSVGREIDVSTLTVAGLREMVQAENPFVDLVLRGPRIDLVGELDSLSGVNG
jgi:predicted nucleotidyltransferase